MRVVAAAFDGFQGHHIEPKYQVTAFGAISQEARHLIGDFLGFHVGKTNIARESAMFRRFARERREAALRHLQDFLEMFHILLDADALSFRDKGCKLFIARAVGTFMEPICDIRLHTVKRGEIFMRLRGVQRLRQKRVGKTVTDDVRRISALSHDDGCKQTNR